MFIVHTNHPQITMILYSLSGGIRYQLTPNIMTEYFDYFHLSDLEEEGLKTLNAIFKRAKKEDFTDESEKIGRNQLRQILRIDNDDNWSHLVEFVRTVSMNDFTLTEGAQRVATNFLILYG